MKSVACVSPARSITRVTQRCAVPALDAYPRVNRPWCVPQRVGGPRAASGRAMRGVPKSCPKLSPPRGLVVGGERPPWIPETPKPGRASQQGATRLTGGS